MKPVAAFFSDRPDKLSLVYSADARRRLEGLTHLLAGHWGSAELGRPELAQVQVLFSTWGMPSLGADALKNLPNLEAVFYAAGSVRSFAEPLLKRNIAVFSAWAANAEPVAEYTLAQILLAGKRVLPAMEALRSQGPAAWAEPECPGNYCGSVGLLGAGAVGRRVAELLQAFKLKILVYDPFLSDADARRLGVERAGLADIFARCQVVSNHLADVPATKGLLTEELFQSLPKGATFLNTGRGATVDEAGLWKVLQRRRDLSAVLDVAEAEPPEASSPAYRLPNVFLTPHLAGSLGPETARMADWMLDEFEAYSSGRPVRFRLNLEQLATLA